MNKRLKIFLSITITTILVFLTSFLATNFVHNYFISIEKEELWETIDKAETDNYKYKTFLENVKQDLIDKEDFVDFDEKIYTLAQENNLRAINISYEDHILKESSKENSCEVEVLGSLDNIKNYIEDLKSQKYFVDVQRVSLTKDDEEYIAKILYTVNFK